MCPSTPPAASSNALGSVFFSIKSPEGLTASPITRGPDAATVREKNGVKAHVSSDAKKRAAMGSPFQCNHFTISEKVSRASDLERGEAVFFGHPVHQFHTQSPCVEEIVWLMHPVEQFLTDLCHPFLTWQRLHLGAPFHFLMRRFQLLMRLHDSTTPGYQSQLSAPPV